MLACEKWFGSMERNSTSQPRSIVHYDIFKSQNESGGSKVMKSASIRMISKIVIGRFH